VAAALTASEENGAGRRFWSAKFEGEGGVDQGGLFRESLREMCAELQAPRGALRLLVPCPNDARSGTAQPRWLAGPHAPADPMRFLGRLLGAAALCEAGLELDLAGLLWKRLLGQEPTWADLEATDTAFCRQVEACRAAPREGWDARRLRWTCPTSAGGAAELRSGGAAAAVAWEERGAYADACVAYRLRGEAAEQVGALRAGLLAPLGPGAAAALALADWRDAERLACGTQEVDLARLRAAAAYDGSLPGGAKHPLAVMFWSRTPTPAPPTSPNSAHPTRRGFP
jgi:hypothetical protein